MATRFRFYSLLNQGSLVSPAISADWGNTAALPALGRTNGMKAARLYMTNLSRTTAVLSMAAGVNLLQWQFISEPIAAITISGTIKGQILTQESVATGNACVQFRAYVISGNGATVRGTLIAVNNAALSSEFALGSTWTNRKIPRGWTGSGQAMSSVAAQLGDRLVFEIGCRVTPPDNGAHGNALTMLGAPVEEASDLPEDETTTDATGASNNPWIEISDNLTFVTVRSEAMQETGIYADRDQSAGVAVPPVQLSSMDGYRLEEQNPEITNRSVSLLTNNLYSSLIDQGAVAGTHPGRLLPKTIQGQEDRGIESSQGGGADPDYIQQRVYDSVVGWCYYTKTFSDPTPLAAETQPNHTNSLVVGSHQLLGIRVKD